MAMTIPPRPRIGTVIFARASLVVVAAAGVCIVGAAAQSGSRRAAVPVRPTDAILAAFRDHAVVALGEGIGHGDEQAHAFRLELLRDPRFAMTVRDVLVEFGNARYQDVIDRFVDGQDVSTESLRHVWQDTTQPTMLADATIYQDLFRAVRELNASLPRDRHVRVLLGDPPIDWERVTTPDEFRAWIEQRDSFPASVVTREVLAKGRKALIIYGQMHFQRKNALSNYDMTTPLAETIVSLLEKDAPRSVFTVWPMPNLETLHADAASWPIPSLAVVAGTDVGEIDFARFRPANEPRFAVHGGQLAPLAREQWLALHAEDQLDAVIYEGPRNRLTFAKPAASLCADPEHVKIRLQRIALLGLPPAEAERLKQECAK
jgi:hypothetical protein